MGVVSSKRIFDLLDRETIISNQSNSVESINGSVELKTFGLHIIQITMS